MKLTIFLLLMAKPEWLSLDRAERAEIADKALGAAFGDGTVTFRFFDAEAFNARVSDVAVIEADTPQAYYFAMERLRDTPLLANPYYEIVEIVPAYEDGYREFENAN
ncbi:darcynin family protein [Thalassovita aquimarina]|uniref:Darcynin 1 n=1 Tax=Thalassovita aquimarina TaxID=2785917 RepID=A0ABS5HRK1_9RHOB|nr:darcynin family protein [Thalassovita aquimarina]MBR9651382.1 hypothetical protein [Thalassovita aquimarina]